MQHTDITLERLKKANKLFFSAANFFQDKKYDINHADRILIVTHATGKACYKIDKNFGLTYTNNK